MLIENEFKKTGVVPTRPDYYTVPPIAELSSEHTGGKLIVKDFILTRRGYGSILFPFEVDLTDINLDEVVQFTMRQVTINPSPSIKRLISRGSNERIVVTLHNIWPYDKQYNAIVDEDFIRKINFVGKLIRLADKQKAVYKGYYPENGSWVFEVNNFGTYGAQIGADEKKERYERRSVKAEAKGYVESNE